MFKNKFPISSLISIAVISIGAFFILLFFSMYEGDYNEDIRPIFMLVGLATFGTGIALLVRKAWARTILTISLIVLSIALLYLLLIDSPPNNIYARAGVFILAVSPSLFFIFLLHNEKVSIEFGDKPIDKETEDILDHFE